MQKTPYIGQLDRKIAVYQEIYQQNTVGERKPELQLITGAWACMEEVSGDEDVEGKVRHLIKRRYTIRYNASVFNLTNKIRIIDGSVNFNVFHLKEIGRKKYLQLLVNDYE